MKIYFFIFFIKIIILIFKDCKLSDKFYEIDKKYKKCFLPINIGNRIDITLKFEKCFGKNFELIINDLTLIYNKFLWENKNQLNYLNEKNCKNELCKKFILRLKNIMTKNELYTHYVENNITNILWSDKQNILKILKNNHICYIYFQNYQTILKRKYMSYYLKNMLKPNEYLEFKHKKHTVHKRIEVNKYDFDKNMLKEMDGIHINPNKTDYHFSGLKNNKKINLNHNRKIIPWNMDTDLDDDLVDLSPQYDRNSVGLNDIQFKSQKNGYNYYTNYDKQVPNTSNLPYPYENNDKYSAFTHPRVKSELDSLYEYPNYNNPLTHFGNVVNYMFNKN